MDNHNMKHSKVIHRLATILLHSLAAACTLAGSLALAQVCASPGLNATTSSISGVINSYYPGTGANVGVGSTSIPLGGIDTSGGGAATAIAAGDLVIVMQMQGAEINFSNSDCYGDGVGAIGCATYTLTTAASYAGGNLASNYRAGAWEYCTATSAAGASLAVICGGASGGTVNAYQASAATGSVGAYRYQVIRVPQYNNVTLTGNVQPAFWNGATGGVLGMQATGTVTMAGFNLDASARGFRGGGVTFLGAFGPPILDPVNGSFFYTSVAGTITGAGIGGEREGSFKGEGIAGTPRLVYNGLTQTGVVSDDYPGGSRARGAPGNAGGGGNNQNGGGGGGGNGGRGGQGGGCWNDVSRPITVGDCGGHGGDGASRVGNNLNLSSTRLIMGGGGGAAHVDGGGTNCFLGGWGGNGGGIIIARVASFSGTGNLLANGRAGFVPNFTAGTCTDGAGGGGAGGTILVATTGSLAGRTFSANGGNGANSSHDRHGPGGGGGGGAVYFSATAAPTLAVLGGTPGTDRGNLIGGTGAGDGVAEPWFATTGAFTALGNTTALSTACSTALAITKTNNTDTLVAGSTTSYTITFSNTGPTAANNAIARDTPSAGLSSCTATGCSGSGSPLAVCPASGLWPNLFTPTGLTLASLPANSSLTFNVTCGVSATGQ
jgi:mucin-19